MAIRTLFAVLLCSLGVNCVLFFPYRYTDCGSVITHSQGVILPRNEACEMKIEVPEGQQVRLYEVDSPIRFPCKKLSITEDGTGDKFSLCNAQPFVGKSGTYTVKINNVEQNARLQFIFEQVSYKCGETVPYERVSSPFTFINNGTEECFLIVVASGKVLRIEPQFPSEPKECTTQIQVAQGKHLKKMVKSSMNVCLDEPIEMDLICGVAIVYLNGPQDTQVQISTSPVSRRLSLFREAKFMGC